MKVRNVSFTMEEDQYQRMIAAAQAQRVSNSEFMRHATDRAAAKAVGVKLGRVPMKRKAAR